MDGMRGAIGVMCKVCRPMGLCPIVFSPAKPSRAMAAYSYCLLPIFNTSYCYGVYIMYAATDPNPYQYVARLLSFGTYVVLTNVAILTAPYRVLIWLRHLKTMEEILMRTKITDKWEKTFAKIIVTHMIALESNIVFLFFYNCTDAHNCYNPVVWNISLMLIIMTLILHGASFQFIFLIVRIYSATAAINKELETFLSLPAYKLTTIRELGLHYISMCDIIRELTAREELVTILFIVAVMGRLMLSTYAIVKSDVPEFFTYEMVMYLLEAVWGLIMCTIMVLILEPCQRTYGQLEQTKLLVNLLLKKNKQDIKLVNELNLLQTISALDTPRFTPFGIVTLDRSLLAQILGSVATYVVTFTQIIT